jgi:4-alpha-glucanotransferase
MPSVRLILALHNHQPVGNFDDVFASAYRLSYLPFLDVLESYPDIRFSLHTSGPLMEWLVENRPEYIARVRALVGAGRVEILGGGFTEPILAMIPHRDRVGQIRSFSDYLERKFGQPIRGMWVPERVWETHFTSALAEAGIEFTVLDDFHFQRSGVSEGNLFGYYLTEDDGRLVKVFPGSERLRYLMPFQEPHDSYEYLRHIAHEKPGATVVFADDGEKFGSWPETFDHVYTNGWLRRFCDMLVGNRDWLETTTFGRVVDQAVPLGKVYLPDSSYREMTEWVLPAERQVLFEHAWKGTLGDPAADRLRPFARAGGYWRNFKAKYPESDEMYARMLGVSNRLAALPPSADAESRESARASLYKGQCNCPYWHGSFGGLYLPHLRNAIYEHLIAADEALDEAERLPRSRATIAVGDFNLDARQEVRLENEHLIAFIRPAMGGHLYELDARRARVNLLATLDRRPEPYHGTITAAALGLHHAEDRAFNTDRVILKEENLDGKILYDRHPRKALVDHFYPLDVTLNDLARCRDVERGDFATGTYLARISRGDDRVTLAMERPGKADGHVVTIRKTLSLEAGSPNFTVDYVLEGLPPDVSLHFAVEMNLAAMAGHADDRYYSIEGRKLGMLDAHLDLADVDGVTLTDEYLDLGVSLGWSEAAALWCFPIQTVSQSEGGFEGVYQSSAVIPHWVVRADESHRWSVRITWTIGLAQLTAGVGMFAQVEPAMAGFSGPNLPA